MKFVNLTPHTFNILNEAGEILLSLPSEGEVRVSEEVAGQKYIDGILVVNKAYGQVELPPVKSGVTYIVSRIVRDAVPVTLRDDLLVPDTGPDSVVRDESGRIIGVRRLQR